MITSPAEILLDLVLLPAKGLLGARPQTPRVRFADFG
jgi:hypothetical protein